MGRLKYGPRQTIPALLTARPSKDIGALITIVIFIKFFFLIFFKNDTITSVRGESKTTTALCWTYCCQNGDERSAGGGGIRGNRGNGGIRCQQSRARYRFIIRRRRQKISPAPTVALERRWRPWGWGGKEKKNHLFDRRRRRRRLQNATARWYWRIVPRVARCPFLQLIAACRYPFPIPGQRRFHAAGEKYY